VNLVVDARNIIVIPEAEVVVLLAIWKVNNPFPG
jgi:hypothetical protein